MTVTYSKEVSTITGFGIFLKLLLRWKGSIYKIIWPDLLLYLLIYYFLNVIYVYGLPRYGGKETFLAIVTYFSKYGNIIPLSFVLGFYVNIVYNRWWSQFSTIPDPDNIAVLVGATVHGNEDRPKIIRRTIIRYVCTAFTITLSMISPKVKRRFPTYNHFVQSGFLNKDEKKLIENLDKENPSCRKYWLPLVWAANVASRARSEGMIKDDMALKDILEQINEFRDKCKKLLYYDWVCVPLVYTQVVSLAVYLYFLFSMIGTQYLEKQNDQLTFMLQFPFMSCIEFFFYMGWLKVAESLINPFGEDDDDFNVNWMIDRHLQVGYLIVDKIHKQHPKLVQDHHWNQTAPCNLPFTVSTQKYMFERPIESTYGIHIPNSEQDLIFRDDTETKESKLLHNRRGRLNILKNWCCKEQRNYRSNLIKVAIEDDDKEEDNTDEEWDEFNLYEDEEKTNKSQLHTSDLEHFNLLKELRLKRKKEILLKCLELLKEDKDQARKLLDEIIE